MVEFVNTESYARLTGQMLEAWLRVAGPVREAQQGWLKQMLEHWGVPSRAEITALAKRMTQVETRLDDLDMRLDSIDAKLDRIGEMLAGLQHEEGSRRAAGPADCPQGRPESEEEAA